MDGYKIIGNRHRKYKSSTEGIVHIQVTYCSLHVEELSYIIELEATRPCDVAVLSLHLGPPNRNKRILSRMENLKRTTSNVVATSSQENGNLLLNEETVSVALVQTLSKKLKKLQKACDEQRKK